MQKEYFLKINKKNNNGYLLLETLISVALFLLIVTVGMSSLLGASAAHQKSQDMRSILDNLSFAMEDMSRNLRLSYNYHCGGTVSVENPKSCPSGTIIFFERSLDGETRHPEDQWGYKIDGSGNIWKSTDGGEDWVRLNPNEIVLDSSSGFSVLGADAPPGDTQQPFVIIKLVGTIKYKSVTTPFSLQTSISQRLIDN